MNFFQKLFGSSPAIDLKQLLNDGAFLLDVRTSAEFNSDHLKGSVNIPVDAVCGQLVKF